MSVQLANMKAILEMKVSDDVKNMLIKKHATDTNTINYTFEETSVAGIYTYVTPTGKSFCHINNENFIVKNINTDDPVTYNMLKSVAISHVKYETNVLYVGTLNDKPVYRFIGTQRAYMFTLDPNGHRNLVCYYNKSDDDVYTMTQYNLLYVENDVNVGDSHKLTKDMWSTVRKHTLSTVNAVIDGCLSVTKDINLVAQLAHHILNKINTIDDFKGIIAFDTSNTTYLIKTPEEYFIKPGDKLNYILKSDVDAQLKLLLDSPPEVVNEVYNGLKFNTNETIRIVKYSDTQYMYHDINTYYTFYISNHTVIRNGIYIDPDTLRYYQDGLLIAHIVDTRKFNLLRTVEGNILNMPDEFSKLVVYCINYYNTFDGDFKRVYDINPSNKKISICYGSSARSCNFAYRYEDIKPTTVPEELYSAEVLRINSIVIFKKSVMTRILDAAPYGKLTIPTPNKVCFDWLVDVCTEHKYTMKISARDIEISF